MQRTIADAEAALAELGQVWVPSQLAPLRDELDEVKAMVSERVAAQVSEMSTDADGLADATHDDLVAIRSSASDLISAAELGTITARDFHARYTELATTLRSSERRVGELTRLASVISEAETDSVGYFDRTVHEKFPLVRPHFSW